MNRRQLLGFGAFGVAAAAAPVMAAACAVMPRRIEDQVIDGALRLENCQNMVISNCTFLLRDKPPYGIQVKETDYVSIVGNIIT